MFRLELLIPQIVSLSYEIPALMKYIEEDGVPTENALLDIGFSLGNQLQMIAEELKDINTALQKNSPYSE